MNQQLEEYNLKSMGVKKTVCFNSLKSLLGGLPCLEEDRKWIIDLIQSVQDEKFKCICNVNVWW